MVSIATMTPWIRALPSLSADVALRSSPLAGRHLLLMLSAPRHGPQRSVRCWSPSLAPHLQRGQCVGRACGWHARSL
jgi:hypothetical protein